MSAQRFCQYCGSAMEPDWHFCERCGGQPHVLESASPPESAPTVFHPPVRVPPAPAQHPAPVQTPTPQSVPVQSVQNDPKNPLKWLLPMGIGCIFLVCVCGLGAVGSYFLFSPDSVSSAPTPTLLAVIAPAPMVNEPSATFPAEPTEILVLTEAPEPTPWPTVESTEASDSLTGSQNRDENSIFDDFSSQALGWPVFDDGKTIIQYEDGAYSLQITEADYFDWAYAPVDFLPNAIQLDVWGLPGTQEGTFGVICQYQDTDNYYYVEIDLGTRQFVIAQVQAGEYISLNYPDENGQYWLSADPLYPSPEQVNHIEVNCDQDFMVLTINDALVYHVTIPEPFSNPGEIALFVYTYPFAGPEGYKVFFDNVGVQQGEE